MIDVFYPVTCSDATKPLYTATSFGHPYPGDKVLTKSIHLARIKRVIDIIDRFATRFSISPFSISNRLAILENIRIGAQQSTYDAELINASKYILGNENLVQMTFHPGLDINLGSGSDDLYASVHAVTSGKVLAVSQRFCARGDCSGYVAIEHVCQNTKFYALYGHVIPHSFLVPGTNVTPGQFIAKIGPYPSSSPHLHFEIATKSYPYEGNLKNYPRYTAYKLNLVLIAVSVYEFIKTTPNPTCLCIPYPMYVSSFTDSANKSFFSYTSFDYGAYERTFGFVDPTNFLLSISGGKIKDPQYYAVNPPRYCSTKSLLATFTDNSFCSKYRRDNVCFDIRWFPQD